MVGGRVVRETDGPAAAARGVVDSREVRAGDLFLGVPGSRVDGGAFAPEVLSRGAWGAVVAPVHAAAAARCGRGAVIEVEDPLVAGEALAAARRASLRCPVVAITGSNGKTTTKDLLVALLGGRRVAATADSFNTRLGVVATLLGAPCDTEVLVVEVGMLGPGDIAARCVQVAPTVAVITNIGRAHLAGAGDLAGVAAGDGPRRRASGGRPGAHDGRLAGRPAAACAAAGARGGRTVGRRRAARDDSRPAGRDRRGHRPRATRGRARRRGPGRALATGVRPGR